MAVWWETATREERTAVLAVPFATAQLSDEDRAAAIDAASLAPAVRETLLEMLFASASGMLLLPIGDVFGWPDRINRPATVGDGNWTWRLPWPADRLSMEPSAMAMATQLREWSRRHGRTND